MSERAIELISVVVANEDSVPFKKGDKVTFRSNGGDVSLFFSTEALKAIDQLNDGNHFRVPNGADATFEAVRDAEAGCCITIVSSGEIKTPVATPIAVAGVLELQWPVPRSPRET